MRAVQITRFGAPEVLEIVDIPEPTAGVNYADTHQSLSRELPLSLGSGGYTPYRACGPVF